MLSDLTVRAWYDVAGRRTKFFDGADTLRYTYGSDGLLATLSVQWLAAGFGPDTFRFFWDGVGRRDSVVYLRPQATVTFGYDRDSHLRLVCAHHAGNTDPGDYLEHRVRYPVFDRDGQALSYSRSAGGGVTSSCADGPGGYVESHTFQYDARHQMRSNGANTYTFDGAGNRLTRRGPGIEDSLQFTAHSNRVWRSLTLAGTVSTTFQHDSNGSRRIEVPSTIDGEWRLYYYNSLGQMTGHKALIYTGGGTNWVGGSTKCKYDALGRRIRDCGEAPNTPTHYAGFDGDNVIRLVGGLDWQFVHGPGTDDPLVASYYVGGTTYRRYYYLTDGGGRQIAFTDSLGNNAMTAYDAPFTEKGGNQAGAIDESQGFGNNRAESPGAPKLSFYRNRYYDQNTGRWTQEDPIGIAGGVNLYQFAGNNPVAYTDPFGLCIWDGCVVEAMAIGMVAFGGVRMVANLVSGKPATEGVAMDMVSGAAGAVSPAPPAGRIAGAIGAAEGAVATGANGSVRVASRAEANIAARIWAGIGGKALRDTHAGQVGSRIIGRMSADETRVARFAAPKPNGTTAANLESKITGSNMHVVVDP